ncbi:MAG: polymerase polymerase protein, partial [Candidatus Parcubacteria bacterium]
IEKIYTALKKGDEAFLKKGIKARMIGLLREHEEDARFSKSLATIRLDAPIAFTLPEKVWSETVDLQKALALCDEFGFRTLRERIRSVLAKVGSIGAQEEFAESSGLASLGSESPDSQIPPARLAEAKVMLWLISSEFTNPSLDDILAFTKERGFDGAYAVLEKQLATLGKVKDVYDQIEKPLIPIVREMGAHGILIDPKVLKDLAKKYGGELAQIEKSIYKHAGHEFNVSSPKQLGDVLFDELKIVPERMKKTAGGQRSTKESELEKIRDMHPIVAEILEYRELKKLLGTYIENLPPMLDSENRLHAEFLQTGAVTGRMASQNPGLQNIPMRTERGRAIRHAFVASKGFTLLGLDYSQIELRIAAILSGDEKLCAIFKSGRDVHQEVASMVFGVAADKVDYEMRRRAKIINFGILYGMGANALRVQLGSTTAEAHQYLEDYFATFKTLSEYLEKTKGFARKHGYTETLFGRRRQFPEMKSSLPYVRAQAERMAINAPIQGTSADIVKLAMVRVDELLAREGRGEDAHLLLQVHDELVYEIRDAQVAELAPKIKSLMEETLTKEEAQGVPIIATMKTGSDWGSMHSI